MGYLLQYSWASLVALLVKNPPALQQTWFQSLGWEAPLEKGMANHSSILAWRIQWTMYSIGSQPHTTEQHGHFTFIISVTESKTREDGGGLGRKTSVLDGVCKMLLCRGRSAYSTLVYTEKQFFKVVASI